MSLHRRQQLRGGEACIGRDRHIDTSVAREFFRLDGDLNELGLRRKTRRQSVAQALLETRAHDTDDIGFFGHDLHQWPAEGVLRVLGHDAATESVAGDRNAELP